MIGRDPREAIDVIYHEADLLDRRDWAAWLDMFTADCLYWAPSWLDEDRLSSDPDREISLICHRGREGLEDRVQRITSGRSLACDLLPRTIHAITNPLAEPDAGGVRVRSHWAVDSYDLRTETSTRLFGRYEHFIQWDAADGAPRIAEKRIEVMAARLPSIVDIYSI